MHSYLTCPVQLTFFHKYYSFGLNSTIERKNSLNNSDDDVILLPCPSVRLSL